MLTESMQRPGRWTAACFAGLLSLALASGARADDITSFSKVRFPKDVKMPLEISVGFVLIDFARINAREESFDIQGYLDLSWRVPSLAGQGKRRMFRDELWGPNIDFVNSLEPVKVQNESVFYVSDDGVVEERVRFSGKFASPLDLRRFPIDRQNLRVIIEPFERTVSEVLFKVNPSRIGRYESAFLSDWDILDLHGEVQNNRYSALDQTRSRFLLKIDVQRRSTFYIWRVLIPLTLLVVASWGVFWVDPNQLQPQISTVVAVLLSMVVFNITIDFALPKVAYLTFIDTHAMVSYFFMIASIATVFTIHHRLNTKGAVAASVIQHRSRFAFPIAYTLVYIAEATFFLA